MDVVRAPMSDVEVITSDSRNRTSPTAVSCPLGANSGHEPTALTFHPILRYLGQYRTVRLAIFKMP
jgi:hypothetical protein